MKNQTLTYFDNSKKFKIKLLQQVEYFESHEMTAHSMFYDEL